VLRREKRNRLVLFVARQAVATLQLAASEAA